ncbi:hypothetical protein [Nonomuraea sp. NPDC050540]|uniref:hypothetical protein n=1 Tax=Nonomuraea sp. NPDC050540 TaxID=3364367 RepID=UPI0037A20FAF
MTEPLSAGSNRPPPQDRPEEPQPAEEWPPPSSLGGEMARVVRDALYSNAQTTRLCIILATGLAVLAMAWVVFK